MKSLVAALVLVSATATAEPYLRYSQSHETWLDAGIEWARVDPGNDAAYTGTLVRFAPNVMVSRSFFIGAELDVGSIGGLARADTLARTTGGEMDPNVHGSLAAAKAVAGLRARTHYFSAAAELAAGMRHAALKNAENVQVAGEVDQGVVEAHGRLDFWATPGLTIGGLAALDLADAHNIAFGLQIGLHYK